MPEVLQTGIYETREELFQKIAEMTKQKKRNVDIARKVGINSGSVIYIQKKLGIYKRKNKVRKDAGNSSKPYKMPDMPELRLDSKPIVLDVAIEPSYREPLRKRGLQPNQRIQPGLTLVLDSSTAQMLYESVVDVTERLGFQPTLTQAIRYMLKRQKDAA